MFVVVYKREGVCVREGGKDTFCVEEGRCSYTFGGVGEGEDTFRGELRWNSRADGLYATFYRCT